MTDEERWRCDCSGPDAITCTSEDGLLDREPDGACACGCHGEYSDDPENWQPLTLRGKVITDAEFRDTEDWLARIDAAEALTEEQD